MYACRHGQDLRKFKVSIRMGGADNLRWFKCDVQVFEHKTFVGDLSDLLEFDHTTISRVYGEADRRAEKQV